MTKEIKLGPDNHLTVEAVYDIANDPNIKVSFSNKAKQNIKKSRAAVERMVREKRVVYGVTTGFGSFKDKIISTENVEALQRNLIRSHSVGVGDLLSPEQIRAAFVVRLNSLSQGFSGVRMELLDAGRALLNKNVIPVVPSQGSVGSSGDLAPLSHMALVMMGEGEAWYKSQLIPVLEPLSKFLIMEIFGSASLL